MKAKTLLFTSLIALAGLASCNGDTAHTITVCASDIPHAEILNGAVAPILKEKGYTLKVSILDWTMQNDAVYNGDYDANYFQHITYLNTYANKDGLKMTAKVHYEPLGIYKGGKDSSNSAEVCNDVSNAIRAFDLLKANSYITTNTYKKVEGGEEKLNFTTDTWTDPNNGFVVKLIAENLLVASMADYKVACLPCNTAMTGNITAEPLVKESDPNLISAKANGVVVNANKYANDLAYKAKMDVLTDALLSEAVSNWAKQRYNGKITCDKTTQIDLRK